MAILCDASFTMLHCNIKDKRSTVYLMTYVNYITLLYKFTLKFTNYVALCEYNALFSQYILHNNRILLSRT